MANFIDAVCDTQKLVERKVTFAEETEILGKAFRLQIQRIMLTYKTHLDKVKVEEWLRSICDSYEIKEIYFAHETGNDATTPYDHTHVCIMFDRAFQCKKARKFDYGDIHPHIRKITTAKHWKNAVRYMAKEDPEAAELADYVGEVAEEFDPEGVWNCATLKEAIIMYCKKPGDIMGIEKLWTLRRKIGYVPPLKELYGWQQYIWDMCLKEPDDRTMFFVVNEGGKAGKSTLTRMMRFHFKERGAARLRMGKAENMYESLYKQCEEKDVGVVLVDCPRTHFFTREEFEVLESIKDGDWTKGKFHVQEVCMKPPHLIVFTNFDIMPLINQDGREWMSEDRCKGIRINGVGEEAKFWKLKKPKPTEAFDGGAFEERVKAVRARKKAL